MTVHMYVFSLEVGSPEYCSACKGQESESNWSSLQFICKQRNESIASGSSQEIGYWTSSINYLVSERERIPRIAIKAVTKCFGYAHFYFRNAQEIPWPISSTLTIAIFPVTITEAWTAEVTHWPSPTQDRTAPPVRLTRYSMVNVCPSIVTNCRTVDSTCELSNVGQWFNHSRSLPWDSSPCLDLECYSEW